MTDLLAASTIFDWIFTDTSTFNSLPAVNGIRSLMLGLSYALFILGLARLLTSSPSEAGGKLLMFVIALVSLTLFPKLAVAIYDVSGKIQMKTGVNPDNITTSMDRLATDAADDAYEDGDRGITDVAGKIGDTLSNLIVGLVAAVLKGFAYVVYIILQVGYLLRDLAFAAALLLIPLALGFIVSPFGKEKGISMLFGALGIALWPLGWLFVDALVQLILSPLDSAMAAPAGTRNGLGRSLPAGAGLLTIVLLSLYFFKILIIIFFGYLQSAIFIQKIMGHVSGQAIRMTGGQGGGRTSQQLANLASAGGGKVAQAARSAGGRRATPGSGSGGSSRFGGRRAAPASNGQKPYRGVRPSFT